MEGIVIDSSIIQHPEKVMDEEKTQREWLETELRAAKANGVKSIVVFQHIPWFLAILEIAVRCGNVDRR